MVDDFSADILIHKKVLAQGFPDAIHILCKFNPLSIAMTFWGDWVPIGLLSLIMSPINCKLRREKNDP
jgi:hypothetical protein